MNCRRCELPTEGFDASPLPGPRAEEILEHACKACFQDWMGQEIMIINEYRLDLSIPKNQALLDDEMARYLKLPSAPEGEAAGPPPEHVPPPE
ncbi:MAG: Fe(2+)-trafficking protein [Acidobacteriota bacterium]